jgi:hypothetical protein
VTLELATHGWITDASYPGTTATANTSWTLLRDQIITTIEAITPTADSARKFRLTRTENASFIAHALGHPGEVYREFDVVPTPTTIPNTEDNQIQLRETEFSIAVAYPHLWALYDVGGHQSLTKRSKNYHAMVAIIEQDLESIMETVGRRGSVNYVNGQLATLERGWRIEDGDGVSFGIIEAKAIYYFAN